MKFFDIFGIFQRKKDDMFVFEARMHEGRLQIDANGPITDKQALKVMKRGSDILTVNSIYTRKLVRKQARLTVTETTMLRMDKAHRHGGEDTPNYPSAVERAASMAPEHHAQSVDIGGIHLVAMRDDRDGIQDFRLTALASDSRRRIREWRIVYNIQYDYYRQQEWKADVLIYDALTSGNGYGHLQWENSVGGMGTNWKNPYPDDHEPVKKEGCDMFRQEGYMFDAFIFENMVKATMNCYIYDDLEEWRKHDLNLITEAHVVTGRDMTILEEWAKAEEKELKKCPFDMNTARAKRVLFFDEYSKDIGVTVPYDPRFID